jgi:hypothetical protein
MCNKGTCFTPGIGDFQVILLEEPTDKDLAGGTFAKL